VGHTLGIFAGSMTSTATLQAALDVMGQQGTVDRLFGRLSVRCDRPDPLHLFHDATGEAEIPVKAQRFHMGEITLGENCAGRTIDELAKDLPVGVQATMIRKGHSNVVPSNDIVLGAGDGLMIVADRQEAIAEAAAKAWAAWSRAGSSGPLGARLHSRLCRQGQHGGSSAFAMPLPAGFRRICCTSGATTWIS